MAPHRFALRCRRLGADGCGERLAPLRHRHGRDPLQRLLDHVVRRDLDPEQLAPGLGDPRLALGAVAVGDDRRRGADADRIAPPGALAHPAQQHRDVRPLAPPVEVQLVHDQERELARRQPDQRPLRRADQHVLEHHVVGEQDVRRVVDDRVARLVPVLAGVVGEAHRALRPVLLAEALERLELAVDQRVHRVDDQRAHRVPLRLVLQHVVDDRHEVGEALARAGAGRGDHRPAARRRPDRLLLVAVQPEVLAEEARRAPVQLPLRRQLAQRRPRLVGRVELQHRVRPELALVQLVADEALDPLVVDVDEALDVVPVLADHPVPELEDVEGHQPRPPLLDDGSAGQGHVAAHVRRPASRIQLPRGRRHHRAAVNLRRAR